MIARKSYYKNPNDRTRRQRLIYESINAYGFENHSFDVLEEFVSETSVREDKEMFWVRTYMSNRNKWPEIGGLNLTDGGIGNNGHKHSEAHKEYMSRVHIGRVVDKEGRERMRQAQLKNTANWVGVDKYDMNGNYLCSYQSISKAAKDLGVQQPNISAVLLGTRKSINGFVFKYSVNAN